MSEEDGEKLTIQIGHVGPTTYQLYETGAPRDYDGFGTLELYVRCGTIEAPTRMIAIKEEHRAWQISRNASGLYGTKPLRGEEYARYATNRLLTRLMVTGGDE